MSSSINQQLSNKVFVPITDDLIYNHPEQIEGPLVPYFAGMECQNWLAIEINPDEAGEKVGKQRSKKRRAPELRLAFSS